MTRLLLLFVLALGLSGLAVHPSHAAGAFMVVFEQHARTGEHAGDVDIAAQSVSASGELLWEQGERAVDVASGFAFERRPAAIPDGSGGAIVVFEIESRAGERAGNTDIAAQRVDAQGKLLWNGGEGSVPVADSKWAERNPVVVSDGSGGAIVIFEQHAREGEYAGDVDIGAQRLSPSGELLWHAGEMSLDVASSAFIERNPHAIPDGAGGAIIVFEAEARTGEYAGDCEIYGQRVDANGNKLWENGQDSLVVGYSSWSDKDPIALPDGHGGAIVVFEQHGRSGEYAGDIDIAAQRISPSGKLLWEPSETGVDVACSVELERHPDAVPDGAGGAIIVFEFEARSGEYAGDTEIAVQRIDANGKLMWNDGESSVMAASSEWIEKSPVVIPGGGGTAILIFEAEALTGDYAGDVDVRAQCISPTGRLLWKDGEESVIVSSSTLLERTVCAIPDGSGGALVAFEMEARTGEHAGDAEIAAQRIDAGGNLTWGDGERSTLVAYSAWSEKSAVLVPR